MSDDAATAEAELNVATDPLVADASTADANATTDVDGSSAAQDVPASESVNISSEGADAVVIDAPAPAPLDGEELIEAGEALNEALAGDAENLQQGEGGVALGDEEVGDGVIPTAGDSAEGDDLEQFAESVDLALAGETTETAGDFVGGGGEGGALELADAFTLDVNCEVEGGVNEVPHGTDYAAQAADDRAGLVAAKVALRAAQKRSADVIGRLSALFTVRRGADTVAPVISLPYLIAKEELRLLNAIEAFAVLRETSVSEQADFDLQASRLQQTLEAKEAHLTAVGEAFSRYKREVSRSATLSVTGQRMPLSALVQYAKLEEEVDAQLAAAELRFIATEISLKKLKTARAAREAMTVGMTVADFEQLRVENSILHEKIEARKDEYAKLIKNATTSTTVLTHVRAKLHAVAIEREKLLIETERNAISVNEQRAALSDAKHLRDTLHKQNTANQAASGFVFNDSLCIDFAATQREIDMLRVKLAELRVF